MKISIFDVIIVTFWEEPVLLLKVMRYRVLILIMLIKVQFTLFSCQKEAESVEVNVDSIFFLINEDISIIEDEIENFEWKLREIFSYKDKYFIGEKMFLVIDSVNVLTDQMLNKIYDAQKVKNSSIINKLSVEHNEFREQILGCVNNYLGSNSARFGLKKIEIETYLSNLNEDLLLQNEFENNTPIIALKMLESQVVRNKYRVVNTIGNMFSYRGNRHSIEFPAIMNFGKIGPISKNDKTKVNIGIQSYGVFNTDDPYKIIIEGDTLDFKDQQPYIEYLLPTRKKGDNELLVRLLSENRLTGEVFESETSFMYFVNE